MRRWPSSISTTRPAPAPRDGHRRRRPRCVELLWRGSLAQRRRRYTLASSTGTSYFSKASLVVMSVRFLSCERRGMGTRFRFTRGGGTRSFQLRSSFLELVKDLGLFLEIHERRQLGVDLPHGCTARPPMKQNRHASSTARPANASYRPIINLATSMNRRPFSARSSSVKTKSLQSPPRATSPSRRYEWRPSARNRRSSVVATVDLPAPDKPLSQMRTDAVTSAPTAQSCPAASRSMPRP